MIVVPIEARAAFILESRFRPLFEQTGFLVESCRPTDLHLQSKSAKGDPKERMNLRKYFGGTFMGGGYPSKKKYFYWGVVLKIAPTGT